VKCPRCGYGQVKYLHRESWIDRSGKKKRDRTRLVDNMAFCKKCEYKGEI